MWPAACAASGSGRGPSELVLFGGGTVDSAEPVRRARVAGVPARGADARVPVGGARRT